MSPWVCMEAVVTRLNLTDPLDRPAEVLRELLGGRRAIQRTGEVRTRLPELSQLVGDYTGPVDAFPVPAARLNRVVAYPERGPQDEDDEAEDSRRNDDLKERQASLVA